jgi:hypothetical protein
MKVRMKNKYKLAIKFFTETKNGEQIHIAYKEIDEFYDIYYLYKYYYNFSVKNINKSLFALLCDKEK